MSPKEKEKGDQGASQTFRIVANPTSKASTILARFVGSKLPVDLTAQNANKGHDAWTMKEVYDTRQEELDEWIDKDKLRISANRKKLEGQNLKASERQKLKSEMESSLQNLKRHEKNIEELKAQRIIERWF